VSYTAANANKREVDHEDSTLAPANFDPAFASESWDPTY